MIISQIKLSQEAIKSVASAIHQGLIPENYMNVESLSHIANVVLSGQNTSNDNGIYELGISIVKTISKNYQDSEIEKSKQQRDATSVATNPNQ